MRGSEALANLMLQFLIRRGKSSQLTARAVASFSKIFGCGVPLPANDPQRFNHPAITQQNILMWKGPDPAPVDNSRYAKMYVWLSFGYWEFVRSDENQRGEEFLRLSIRTLVAAWYAFQVVF